MIRLFVFPWIFFIILFFRISLPPGKSSYLHFPEILTKNLSEDLHRLWKYRTFSNTWKNYSKLNEKIPRFIGFLMNETENWCLTYIRIWEFSFAYLLQTLESLSNQPIFSKHRWVLPKSQLMTSSQRIITANPESKKKSIFHLLNPFWHI